MERPHPTAEERRLAQEARREADWKRWGTYLAEREWGTVREDYSADGEAWEHFSHDQARSRAYRWGEDGLLGICDRQCRLAFALALWNGRDPILKERLFGLTGKEGNHGEDVKELYWFLDALPTHAYAKALYKYPQAEFPYRELVEENRRRGHGDAEHELLDTGVLDNGRYFDVLVEYAKAAPQDLLVRVTVSNRGDADAPLALLPTLWFRNTWSWGREGDGYPPRPSLAAEGERAVVARHATLGDFRLDVDVGPQGEVPELLFTENESDVLRLWGHDDGKRFTKDAFHRYVVQGEREAVNPARSGTKAAALHRLTLPAGGEVIVRLRLCELASAPPEPFGEGFGRVFAERIAEADAFHAARTPAGLDAEQRRVARQAYAGLLWSKQVYHYVVDTWLEGDPAQPPPPARRREGRNSEWTHLFNRDVVSMPDTWEYPWYAAWDLAFHMIPFARIDPDFAKQQLGLFLREWYMHPNGALPAYEWALGDVNPPVHAWACWRVYKKCGPSGARDRRFLASCFQKLLLNFTWWVNRKDHAGRHVFSGGFLGMDNVGVFDRSKPLPGGGWLDQADGTAWMAFYCGTMLSIALELAREDPVYEDMASKFFEHFVAIADAMNHLGGSGLWSESDGFYHDRMHTAGRTVELRLRSMVGLVPLIAVEVLEQETIDRLPGFAGRMRWFLRNRRDLAQLIGYMEADPGGRGHRLLSIPSRERLERLLRYLLDEGEFLSPYGLRSLSKVHEREPYVLELDGARHEVRYTPGEADTGLFGGNSNWRGPVWFPLNFLLIEALERYDHFYGDTLQVELPTGSGRRVTLDVVARELARRLTSLFLPDAQGRRPCQGGGARHAADPHGRELVLFHEYFHAETGRGLGASHQTGWTALVATLLEVLSQDPALASTGLRRRRDPARPSPR